MEPGLAQDVHEQVDDQDVGEPVEHDGGDDDVAAAPRLQVARDESPGRAEQGRGADAERDQQGRGQASEMQADERHAEPGKRRLAFSADVEQAGVVGDRDRKPREDEVRRVEEREA